MSSKLSNTSSLASSKEVGGIRGEGCNPNPNPNQPNPNFSKIPVTTAQRQITDMIVLPFCDVRMVKKAMEEYDMRMHHGEHVYVGGQLPRSRVEQDRV